MNYYVLRPDLTPYEGIIVDKDSKLKFKNDKVEQELNDLELTIKQKDKTDKYEVESTMIVHLEEGEILLFEKESRGYFLPVQPIGSIKEAIDDYRGLATALDGKDYEVKEIKEG